MGVEWWAHDLLEFDDLGVWAWIDEVTEEGKDTASRREGEAADAKGAPARGEAGDAATGQAGAKAAGRDPYQIYDPLVMTQTDFMLMLAHGRFPVGAWDPAGPVEFLIGEDDDDD